MSNIIREIFVEDHVQQVSTSIKETSPRSPFACRMACENIFDFLKSVFYCYDSASFYLFASGTEYLGDFWSFSFFTDSLRT